MRETLWPFSPFTPLLFVLMLTETRAMAGLRTTGYFWAVLFRKESSGEKAVAVLAAVPRYLFPLIPQRRVKPKVPKPEDSMAPPHTPTQNPFSPSLFCCTDYYGGRSPRPHSLFSSAGESPPFPFEGGRLGWLSLAVRQTRGEREERDIRRPLRPFQPSSSPSGRGKGRFPPSEKTPFHFPVGGQEGKTEKKILILCLKDLENRERAASCKGGGRRERLAK